MDIIQFSTQLGMEMRPCFGSTLSVNEALELFDVIYSTLFQLLEASWRSRSDLHTDYHTDRTRAGANLLY